MAWRSFDWHFATTGVAVAWLEIDVLAYLRAQEPLPRVPVTGEHLARRFRDVGARELLPGFRAASETAPLAPRARARRRSLRAPSLWRQAPDGSCFKGM